MTSFLARAWSNLNLSNPFSLGKTKGTGIKDSKNSRGDSATQSMSGVLSGLPPARDGNRYASSNQGGSAASAASPQKTLRSRTSSFSIFQSRKTPTQRQGSASTSIGGQQKSSDSVAKSEQGWAGSTPISDDSSFVTNLVAEKLNPSCEAFTHSLRQSQEARRLSVSQIFLCADHLYSVPKEFGEGLKKAKGQLDQSYEHLNDANKCLKEIDEQLKKLPSKLETSKKYGQKLEHSRTKWKNEKQAWLRIAGNYKTLAKDFLNKEAAAASVAKNTALEKRQKLPSLAQSVNGSSRESPVQSILGGAFSDEPVSDTEAAHKNTTDNGKVEKKVSRRSGSAQITALSLPLPPNYALPSLPPSANLSERSSSGSSQRNVNLMGDGINSRRSPVSARAPASPAVLDNGKGKRRAEKRPNPIQIIELPNSATSSHTLPTPPLSAKPSRRFTADNSQKSVNSMQGGVSPKRSQYGNEGVPPSPAGSVYSPRQGSLVSDRGSISPTSPSYTQKPKIGSQISQKGLPNNNPPPKSPKSILKGSQTYLDQRKEQPASS